MLQWIRRRGGPCPGARRGMARGEPAGRICLQQLLNCHTRRYHGLLVPCSPNRQGVMSLLSKFEDMIILGGSGRP